MRVCSLMYHDVVAPGAWDTSGFAGPAAAAYKLDRAGFAAHLDAITAATESAGWLRGAPPERLGTWDGRGPGGTPDVPGVVFLHFDDGGACAPRIADALEARGWRGVFHITTDRIGTAGFVTASDIRALASRGHAIGTHSCSHPPHMATLDRASLLCEWMESRDRLAGILGRDVTVAAVPGGSVSRPVIAAARDAGIRVLFTSEPRLERIHPDCKPDNILVLGRFAIRRTTTASTAAALATAAPGARRAQWLAWNSKKLVKQMVGPGRAASLRGLLDR